MKWTVTSNQDPCSYPGKNHLRGAQGFPLFQVTSLRPCTQDPIATNKAGPSCLTQGSNVRGSLMCPGLSHYHLRGLLKGSKSLPLVCYPSSTFCIMRAFIAHLIPSARKSVIFYLFIFLFWLCTGEVLERLKRAQRLHLYLKSIP